ncbi:Succinyl-diaminopimelate desuccinylase [Frankliniella fusca]|uniref:Succinyl-diaminopimelate desuccinylase n=1 Tax=Frankliniella fusca TaxID=407009 RepID=A0AAE1I1C2_9NEOP|nr:Succinyl-diaminopimelate desuccinylase [Frankliniella fusca]
MKYLYSANADLAVDHIVSCFVLHNFMILNGEKLIDLRDPTVLEEEFVDIEEDEEEGNEDDPGGENENFNQRLAARRQRGVEKRIQLVQQFSPSLILQFLKNSYTLSKNPTPRS